MIFAQDQDEISEVKREARKILKDQFQENLPKSNCQFASLRKAAESLPIDYEMVLFQKLGKFQCYGGAKKISILDNAAECCLAGAKMQHKSAWLISRISLNRASVKFVSLLAPSEKYEIKISGHPFVCT